MVVTSGANTLTNPTFSPNGLTAHTITKQGGAALVPGDIPAALAVCIFEYNLDNTRWELVNPKASNIALTNLANQAAYTFLANLTSGSAAPTVATPIQAFNLIESLGWSQYGNLGATPTVNFVTNWKWMATVNANITAFGLSNPIIGVVHYIFLQKSDDATERTLIWASPLDVSYNWADSAPLTTMGTTAKKQYLVQVLCQETTGKIKAAYVDMGQG
jgi:hypothetical protein